MSGAIAQIVGIVLVVTILIDIYLAVLYLRSGKGWLGVCCFNPKKYFCTQSSSSHG
jgi:hypothetical protein